MNIKPDPEELSSFNKRFCFLLHLRITSSNNQKLYYLFKHNRLGIQISLSGKTVKLPQHFKLLPVLDTFCYNPYAKLLSKTYYAFNYGQGSFVIDRFFYKRTIDFDNIKLKGIQV